VCKERRGASKIVFFCCGNVRKEASVMEGRGTEPLVYGVERVLRVGFVTGPTGPLNLRAPNQNPHPAPLNGPWWGLFFFITRPWPPPGPRPVQGPERPFVGSISPPRALYFLYFSTKAYIFFLYSCTIVL